MDNNTRKLLNLTDESLTFDDHWLSREARHNRSVNMITGRLTTVDKSSELALYMSDKIDKAKESMV